MEISWTAIAQCGVATSAIVEDFDVLEEVLPGLCPSRVAHVMNAFVLQAVEEALGRGIVPAVALAAHGNDDAELLE